MLKSFTPTRIKVAGDAALGQVEAVFATLNVVDADGDVILPGAIKDGTQVVISAFLHESWKGKLPVGRGTIHEVGDELVVKAQFFMDTTHGLDTFNTVKGLAGDPAADLDNLGEWSFSLQQVESASGTWEGVKANVISAIRQVKEVSPVLIGAGVNTRTLAVKDGTKQLESSIYRLLHAAGQERWGDRWPMVEDYDVDEGFVVYEVRSEAGNGWELVRVEFTRTDTAVELSDTETPVHRTAQFIPKSSAAGGLKFSEHLQSVVADVKALTERAREVVALRAAKGKSLGDEARQQLTDLGAALAELDHELDTPNTKTTAIDPQAEYLRFQAHLNGVTT